MLTGIGQGDSHTDRDYEESNAKEIIPAAGLAGGTAGGTAIGIGACAPAAPMPLAYVGCLSGFMLAGMAVGFGTATTGYSVGYSAGYSERYFNYLKVVALRINEKRDYQQELADHLTQQLPSAMQSKPELADIHVMANLARINLLKRPDDKMQIETVGLLVFSSVVEIETDTDEFFRPETQKERRINKIEFRSLSPEEDIELWIEDDGKRYGVAISDCLTDLSSQMTATLQQAWEPSAGSETE
jgi:hypothetical protein